MKIYFSFLNILFFPDVISGNSVGLGYAGGEDTKHIQVLHSTFSEYLVTHIQYKFLVAAAITRYQMWFHIRPH